MNKSFFFLFFYFKAFLSVFVSLLFTVNSITCEVLTLKRDVKVLGMPVRKMRVEVFDGSGNRYTVTFEGQVTREKALRLLDLIELLGGMPGVNPELGGTSSETSKFEKVRLIVQRRFPIAKNTRSYSTRRGREPPIIRFTMTFACCLQTSIRAWTSLGPGCARTHQFIGTMRRESGESLATPTSCMSRSSGAISQIPVASSQ